MKLRNNRYIEYIPFHSIPKKRDIIMIFDTETTGLFCPQYTPYMIQLAYILYDTKSNVILETFNEYIKLKPALIIPDNSSNIHGITLDKIENGVLIEDALATFYHAYMKCGKIIGHNIKYDIQVIRAEIERNFELLKSIGCIHPEYLFQQEYQEKHRIKCICTMYSTVKYCNLKKESKRLNKDGSKSYYIKFPKLEELYVLVFQKPVETKLHDALEDVKLCMECYLKLVDQNHFD